MTRYTKLLQTILEDSVKASTLVLDTPTPEVFLIEFTDSVLLYEIRLYVNNTDHWMPITHEVHSLVLEKMQQQGLTRPEERGADHADHCSPGASSLAPENTLKAMVKALELGAPTIEIDVQAADGELWVFHDRRLERCTNGKGY